MKRLLSIFLFLPALVSCMKEADSRMEEKGREIAFSLSLAEPEQVEQFSDYETASYAAGQVKETKVYVHSFSSEYTATEGTKAAMVSSLYDNFSLFGYLFSGGWTTSCKPNLAYNVCVSRTPSWTADRELKWPGNQNVKFYAISPSAPSGLTLSSSYNDAGAPVVEYTVPASVSSQLDLLDSESTVYSGDGSNASTGVSMAFKHILTGIKFKVAAFGSPFTFKSLTIEGVYNHGRHVLGSSAWTDLSGNGTYSVSADVSVGEEGVVELTSGENEMMLMPQTCPSGAKLTMLLEYGGEMYELSVDLSGQVWGVGKEITYTVSTSSSGWLRHILDVDPVCEMSDITGVQDVTSVVSYSINVFGARVPMPWTVQFSTDDGVTFSSTCPSWVTSFTSAGVGGKDGEGVTASFEDRASENQPSVWSFRPTAGSPSNRVDLSLVSPFTRETTSRETANCYVVDGPGYYKIPLYYGNSIVAGAENPVSYTKQSATNQIDFVDGEGNIISTGNIVDQLSGTSNVGNASLVWSTVHDLVTVSSSIEYSGNVGYICFNVLPEHISEGSACIGLLKKGSTTEYVWSWHIWLVSPERGFVDEMYTNAESYSFSMLNASLGSMGPLDKTKAERRLVVNISNPHISRTFTVVQPSSVSSPRGVGSRINTYYLYGCPVVFPIKKLSEYDSSIQVTNSFTTSSSICSMKDVITKPYCIHTSYNITNNFNAWDADRTSSANHNELKKTVYDPSPAMHQVPFKNFCTRMGVAENVIRVTESGVVFKKTAVDTEGSEWQYTSKSSPSSIDSGDYWSVSSFGTEFPIGASYFGVSNGKGGIYNGAQLSAYMAVRPMKRQ